MTGTNRSSNIRDRSRAARQRSKGLRLTSQQLRESLENLRACAAGVNGGLRESHKLTSASTGAEGSSILPRTPLDFASMVRERVRKARMEAQAQRRRAADLRNQAAEFRARSENLRSNSTAV